MVINATKCFLLSYVLVTTSTSWREQDHANQPNLDLMFPLFLFGLWSRGEVYSSVLESTASFILPVLIHMYTDV